MRLYIPFIDTKGSIPHGRRLLDLVNRIDRECLLEEMPWGPYMNPPEVHLKIGYCHRGFLLGFRVNENHLRAKYTEPNQPVYEDSCVEFFVNPGQGAAYYNFEFNAIGTTLVQRGKSRADRRFLPEHAVGSITTESSLGKEAIELTEKPGPWTLAIFIPFRIFDEIEDKPLPGDTMTGNFYKCGDGLPEPHYLSWKRVENSQPDFHRPEYFGILEFE